MKKLKPANRGNGPRPKSRSGRVGSQYELWAVLRAWGVGREFSSIEWAEAAGVPRSTAVHYATSLRKSGVLEITQTNKNSQSGGSGHRHALLAEAGTETPIVLDDGDIAFDPNVEVRK